MKTLIVTAIVALAIAGGTARMQEPKTHDHGEQTMPMPPMHGMPMSMTAQDDKLEKLAAEMNAAKGNDRIDKLVAVVNELVAERKAMHDHMKHMHE